MLRPRHCPLRVLQLGGISPCSATLPGLVSNTHCIHIPRKAPLCAAGNSQAKSIEEAFFRAGGVILRGLPRCCGADVDGFL